MWTEDDQPLLTVSAPTPERQREAMARAVKRERCSTLPGAPLNPTVEKFLDVLDEARELHLRKSRDYGAEGDPYANVRGSEGWGLPAWAGAMLRANDKVVRLQSFVKNGALANEGVEDSLIDIVVYAAIALALFREETA